jgi:hypothetical protein
MTSIIKLVTHPEPMAIYQARKDHAHLTGQTLVEPAYWFEDTTSGRTYHDIYGCIGWPSDVSDKDVGLPGYVGIVGVERPKTLEKDEYYDPQDAIFLLLDEYQSRDVPQLIEKTLELREKYGFGIHADLLTAILGDPEKFITTMALRNERLIHKKGEKAALLIAPPDDFYTPKVFETYVRSLQSAMFDGRQRFFFGGNQILRERINEFRANDPAIMAIGGLVHSLLNRCMWMSQIPGSTMFSLEEAV